MKKLLLLIFFTSFFSADREIDWFYVQEGRVWYNQGESLTFPVDASLDSPYEFQYSKFFQPAKFSSTANAWRRDGIKSKRDGY